MDTILTQKPYGYAASALFGQTGSAKQLLKEEIAIALLKNELGPGMKNAPVGKEISCSALAAWSILSLRNFLEALLYLAFPLVIVLSLLSFGFRLILHWLRLFLWISTWPILYSAVDLFLHSLWSFRTRGILNLTLANRDRLLDLYSSIEITAALALVCIPLITWVLIKSSISQIVHLASFPTESGNETKTLELAPNVASPRQEQEETQSAKRTFGGFAGAAPTISLPNSQSDASFERAIQNEPEKLVNAGATQTAPLPTETAASKPKIVLESATPTQYVEREGNVQQSPLAPSKNKETSSTATPSKPAAAFSPKEESETIIKMHIPDYQNRKES
jgi:hypothetical protein